MKLRDEMGTAIGHLLNVDDDVLRQYIWQVDIENRWENGKYLSHLALFAKVKPRHTDPLENFFEATKSQQTGACTYILRYYSNVQLGKGVTLNRREKMWYIGFDKPYSSKRIAVHEFVEKHQLKTRLSKRLNAERQHCEAFIEDVDSLKALRKKK